MNETLVLFTQVEIVQKVLATAACWQDRA